MSETTNPPAELAPIPALPLFFHRVVGVNPELHGALRLDRSAGVGYAAAAQAVPVGLGEMEIAAQHYPILFTTGPTPSAVALLGLREGENLYVQPDGSWRPDAYLPAYVRAFPFIFVEDDSTKALYVGMEPDAACLRPDTGTPLFEDGKPTAALNESVAFCSAFRDNLNATAALTRALEAEGLLEDEEASITFTHGGVARVRGFRVVKAERLDQLSDETFLDWRRRGWISAIYAHLYSQARWGRLIDLAAPAPVAH